MSTHVVIVGGGLAGLAAAAALARRGLRLTLLESRPRLGGRASSFVDRRTGERIDNCQHVALGCCTNFVHFCRSVGIDEYLERQRELYFVAPQGTIDRFAAGWLPAPLHLWRALRRLSFLGPTDLRCIRRGLTALARGWPGLDRREAPVSVAPGHAPLCPGHPSHTEKDSRLPSFESFDRWLRDQSQTPRAVERFWNLVLVSALSETLERISLAAARKVFVDGFLANRRGWEVLIPTVPLDELYGERLRSRLASGGAELRLQTGVSRVVIEGERALAVELRGGERIAADEVIVAVPHYLLPSLLPDSLRRHPQLAGAARLEPAPISSVHLWFDRPITELPHAVFVGRLSQWLFHRKPLATHHSRLTNHYYQIVISSSRHLAPLSQQETIDAVVRELAEVWPAAGAARLLHARVLTEHRAVFSPLPGSDTLRPPQQSPVGNLQLAGDWTRTGWPATMESAVRSGYLAAENVLSRLGRPEKLMQPDLPTSRLARFMFGLHADDSVGGAS